MMASPGATGSSGDWNFGGSNQYSMLTSATCQAGISTYSLLNQCKDFAVLNRGATSVLDFTGTFATTYADYRVEGPT